MRLSRESVSYGVAAMSRLHKTQIVPYLCLPRVVFCKRDLQVVARCDKRQRCDNLLQHTTATHYCNTLLQHTTATHYCITLLQHTTATHWLVAVRDLQLGARQAEGLLPYSRMKVIACYASRKPCMRHALHLGHPVRTLRLVATGTFGKGSFAEF